MSQLSQQNEGPSDAQTQLHQFIPQDSPTVGRGQVYYPPNNSSPTADSGRRSQRKAAPSPLQTSTTATSPLSSVTPTRSTFPRTGADNTSPSSSSIPHSPQQPRSPTERLDDLLASEKSFYTSETSSIDSIPEAIPRYARPANETNEATRSVSDPVLTSKPPGGFSSTGTRPTMAAMNPAHRADLGRAPPRTSSIDSAISSISGNGHSKSGSQDIKPDGSTDIAGLIRAAGSPEALIQHMLDAKQSMSAQNTQLWRLVDKQRAMILGLNKDLASALKDRERYRKKFKELAAQQISNPSPVDSNPGVPSEAGSATSSDTRTIEVSKPPSMEALVSAGLRDAEHHSPHSPIDVALAPYPITPPAMQFQAHSLNNMVAAEHKMPSPTQHAFQQFNPDAQPAGFEAGQKERKAVEIAREVPYNANLPPSRSKPSDPPKGPPPNVPPPRAPMSSQTPTLAIIGATPNPDEGLKSFPTPPRKAPPAPLNLGRKNNASSHLRQASGTGDETDSDYDDILEVDELPAFTERGRRKTREEDDREREIAAQKDAEMRSLSKKSAKSSKSRPTTPKDGKFPVRADPMPTSPRTIAISPAEAHLRTFSGHESNSGSLAGVLSEASGSGVMSPPLMSPGLPLSPRPMDRPLGSPMPRGSNHSSVASPPLSPRMGGFPGAVPLSPRAPRAPIPLPPNTPMSITSPGALKGEPLQLVSTKPLATAKKAGDHAESSPQDENSPVGTTLSVRSGVYKGLITEEYPDLLLPPNALPSIDVRVASSRLKPSRSSIMFPKNFEEDPVFTLAVFARSDGKELWRVEKDSTSLANLDQVLKQSPTFTAKTPERSLFSGHAPAKVDARRAALDKYLDEVLNTQMDMKSALELCRYLSTNAMEPYAEDIPGRDSGSQSPVKTGPGGRPLKNGYLTKRGKNFGGWKARYFVLDGPVFKYYDAPGGPNLGTIKLQSAQIGKQQQHSDNSSPSRGEDEVDNQYRHAFLILEPKRKDSSSLVRHVLCAESDKERDEWVLALLQYVDFKDEDGEEAPAHHNRTNSAGSGHVNGSKSKKKMHSSARNQPTPDQADEGLRGVSYETTKAGNAPVGVRQKNSGTPSPPNHGYERDPLAQMPQSKSISAPKNAQVIQDSSSWGNRQNMLAPAGQDERIRQKKRSFFGFGPKPRASAEMDTSAIDSNTNLSQLAYEQHGPIRPAFGAPLGEAVRYNHPVNVDIELPAVVYRCIEYLDAKNAAMEEGIFRLSGSSVVIKALKERFNIEGDIALVSDEQYYDIHAVASLLKQYLRELPQTILTRELHLEFVAVTELNDMGEKVRALNGLVHRLPRANNALLRYLSGFLINIINNSDRNKMTVRNVGIVFSPTLNIPQPVFALFLQQYDDIFGQEPDDHGSAVEVTVTAPPLTPEDIRSPRRQKFQELPTPSYDQQTFQRVPAFTVPQHYQPQPYDTGFTPLQTAAYEQKLQAPTMAGPEYGRSAPTLAGPSYEQFAGSQVQRQYAGENSSGTKSKRRESSMFGMNIGLGQRKPSNNRLNDGRLVDEESFFD